MASVTLTGWWINDGADLSDAHYFAAGESKGNSPSVPVEVRAYAGGRRRAIASAGRDNSWPLSFTWVSPDDLAWLESRLGMLVLVRDPKGRAVWGTYSSIQITDYPGYAQSAVEFTLQALTHDPAV